MREYSREIPSRTMGLDLGDQQSDYCVVDERGEVVERGRVKTTPEGMEKKLKGVGAERIVLEVGTHSPWVSRMLEAWGREVVVANARRVKLIAQNDGKRDAVDAELLARLGRVDVTLLWPIEHRGAEAQADLARIRTRDALVRARSQLIGHVRGSAKPWGVRLPSCSAESFHVKVKEAIPTELKGVVEPLLQILSEMTQQIRAYDREVERQCQERYPETELLRQVGGVGPLTSLAYVLTLERKERFRSSRAVGKYLGLIPKQQDSGEQEPQLPITKAGDGLMRRLLVNSAHYVLGVHGPDSDLRRWGLRMAERGGKRAKKRAVVAVARKLAVLLHVLWSRGEIYEPLRQNGSRVGSGMSAVGM